MVTALQRCDFVGGKKAATTLGNQSFLQRLKTKLSKRKHCDEGGSSTQEGECYEEKQKN